MPKDFTLISNNVSSGYTTYVSQKTGRQNETRGQQKNPSQSVESAKKAVASALFKTIEAISNGATTVSCDVRIEKKGSKRIIHVLTQFLIPNHIQEKIENAGHFQNSDGAGFSGGVSPLCTSTPKSSPRTCSESSQCKCGCVDGLSPVCYKKKVGTRYRKKNGQLPTNGNTSSTSYDDSSLYGGSATTSCDTSTTGTVAPPVKQAVPTDSASLLSKSCYVSEGNGYYSDLKRLSRPTIPYTPTSVSTSNSSSGSSASNASTSSNTSGYTSGYSSSATSGSNSTTSKNTSNTEVYNSTGSSNSTANTNTSASSNTGEPSTSGASSSGISSGKTTTSSEDILSKTVSIHNHSRVDQTGNEINCQVYVLQTDIQGKTQCDTYEICAHRKLSVGQFVNSFVKDKLHSLPLKLYFIPSQFYDKPVEDSSLWSLLSPNDHTYIGNLLGSSRTNELRLIMHYIKKN
uniref:Ras-associating domain-containing protein n=1 Tax=Rhabditophanes sp. KR3021 TaxID=114890 RepID=A0AC35TP98_9BILA